MSAIGMGRAAAASEVSTLDGEGATDFLGRVVQYIPADIVAAYVAVFALCKADDGNFASEWINAYVFLALTPFVIIVSYLAQYRKDQPTTWPKVKDWPWFKLGVGIVAYITWVFALPGTPFLDWTDVTGFAQMLVLAAATILLGGLGTLLDD